MTPNGETPRERLFRALNGEPTERTPLWLLFPYHPAAYYVDVRAHPDYRRVFEFGAERGVIALNRRNPRAPLFAPDVIRADETVAGRDGPVRRVTLRCGDRTLLEESPGAGRSGKRLLSTDEDLETFLDLPLELDARRIEAALSEQFRVLARERDEFPRDMGAMMLDLGSPINALYHSADLESFALWSLTHADRIEAWLSLAQQRLEIIYRYFLERDMADVYFLVGSELAAPPLVSLETFRRWVVPWESRLIRLIRSYGKKVIQHFHGQIRELLPDFAAMAPDGLHTIEAPPVGNCTLSQAWAATGERITLIGNIQYDEFRSATPDEMRGKVQAVLAEAAGHRFILSPTAGPFDPHPSARLIENYRAFIEAGSTAVNPSQVRRRSER